MSELPDPAEPEALLRAIATSGDRTAFAALFTSLAPRVKAYLMRLGADATSAEEMTQETMLTVWRKAALFNPGRASVATWVFAIARNRRIDSLRRAGLPVLGADPVDVEQETAPDAGTLFSAAERARRVRSALDTLPPAQAEVVRLAFFDDRPHSEIEQALGIPLGTVKSRLRLAMSKPRALLNEDI
jgi:RNA polymerase sigma-70 factor (ECF subfamily)